MKVWWCGIHNDHKADEHPFCWQSDDTSPPCQMVEMELHPAGSRIVTAEALVIPAKEGQQEDPIEVGFCIEHYSVAERYPDGSWGCWWECIVEASGNHRPNDFVPLLDALTQSKEKE